jgi:hypothetical protein
MSKKDVITFRGDKKIWDKWVLQLRSDKIKIWNKIKQFIEEDMKK